jgi:hypothetical protein
LLKSLFYDLSFPLHSHDGAGCVSRRRTSTAWQSCRTSGCPCRLEKYHFILFFMLAGPAKVGKFRAIKDYSGDVSVKKGATVFVIGDKRADGTYQVMPLYCW